MIRITGIKGVLEFTAGNEFIKPHFVIEMTAEAAADLVEKLNEAIEKENVKGENHVAV